MDKNIQDIAFLCGIQYLEKYKIIKERSDAFYDMLSDDTNFLRRLKYFIHELSNSVDSEILSDILRLPKYFIYMTNPENYRHGFCVICNTHQSKINTHLKIAHKFSNATINEYKKMFFNSCYYFMVSEKLIRDLAPKKRKKMIKAHSNGQDEIAEKCKPCKVNLSCADCGKSIIHICNKNKSSFSPGESED